MKVGYIVTPNQKGQMVIPKKMRELLNIKPNAPLNLSLRGQGIYMYPIREVLPSLEPKASYLELLKATRGAWGKDKGRWEEKKKLELKASRARKKEW